MNHFRHFKPLSTVLAIQFAVGFALMGGALCVTDCHEDERPAGHDSHCLSHGNGLVATLDAHDHEEDSHFGVCSGPVCPCHQNPVPVWTRVLTPDPEPVDAPRSEIEPLSPGVVLDILHIPLT